MTGLRSVFRRHKGFTLTIPDPGGGHEEQARLPDYLWSANGIPRGCFLVMGTGGIPGRLRTVSRVHPASPAGTVSEVTQSLSPVFPKVSFAPQSQRISIYSLPKNFDTLPHARPA